MSKCHRCGRETWAHKIFEIDGTESWTCGDCMREIKKEAEERKKSSTSFGGVF
jgi:hypothetical protein